MKRQSMPLYVVALAIVLVGGLALGVELTTLALGLMVLACPLMMLFMHGGHARHDRHADDRAKERHDTGEPFVKH